jgi:ABC-type branched-subunit amino acid transport system substrate-binding protein
VQLIGGSGWLDPRVIDPGEGNTDNALFTAAFFPDAGDARARAFVDAFIARYAVGPTPFEAEAYDSARLALDALSRSEGGANRDALRAALLDTSGFVGVTGVLSMLESGQADRPLVMLTVQGDQIRLRGSEEEEKVIRAQGYAP